MVNQRFAFFTEEEKEEKRQSLTPAATKKATLSAVKTLRDYLAAKGKPTNFASFAKDELDAKLADFYFEVRTAKTNQLYKKTSFEGLRYGINRFLKGPLTTNPLTF
jgi:hypothetical protein